MSRRSAGTIHARAWRALRLVIFARDGWRCRVCGKAGRLEGDHVIPVQAGGDLWDRANLQTLCRGCHLAKSRREQAGGDPDHHELRAWREYIARLS